ncbi:MAG: LysM peptidoglycan-binding domain-containing protein [Planctomycetes bacterium]|nr:LysM peptidoglycan-binding domain-containing protein [Planctomycetota bacterium]
MQKIERYGVIALVVLLVTILAVSLWGEGSSWKFWEKKDAQATTADASKLRRGPYTPPSADGSVAALEPHTELGGLPISTGTEALVTPLTLDGAAGNALVGAPLIVGGPSPIPTPIQPIGAQPKGLMPVIGAQPMPMSVSAPIVRSGDLVSTPVSTLGARTYTVKSGDTLGAIASRELGSASRWTEIQSLNASLNPNNLKVGTSIQLPAGARAVAASAPRNEAAHAAPKSKPATGRSYVVKSGDSLSRIASRELGDAGRWTEIRDLNPGLNPDRLKVGAELALPKGMTVAKAQAHETTGWSPRTSGKSLVQ